MVFRCKRNYEKNKLEKTSVIICFHNEAFTALLRSVHSVLDRSPPELLEDVILVDDASYLDILKKPLDDYVAQLQGKVKIVRLEKRSGLIQARLKGAEAAKAPILTFLDSHIECLPGWLEPLLYAIHENNKTVIAPVIVSIKDDTLAVNYVPLKSVQVGGFTWNLVFNWHYPPKRDLERPDAPFSPISTPTIAGGLFSIHRNFFDDLGRYDPQFEVWGAENLELSFKTWMCHGRLVVAPCSQVGHIFRSRSPYKWEANHKSPLAWNNARLAEVVLGEYKRFYFVNGNKAEFGDVSDRKAILQKLNCHDFKWYLNNIYPEKFDPSKSLIIGRIRNPTSNLCLDADHKATKISVYPCHKLGGNQVSESVS
ncbi:UDP-N-acetyl-alpha-D-galactosamine polypeptide N-acetylgalactosaminyltransferase [Cichlidogyrus casuarinus]|uniref:Polypeptide N-acetylgalactosaminyltransferase n=1 Tax=Cichlidogyrus casuarinus TaxID=1844966 RepID=A0ABD2QAZ2_9PLAT